MSHIEKLSRLVGRKIQMRGKEYFEKNAVRILFADSEFVSARISGLQEQEYDVDLEREKDSLIYSCDCLFFDEHSEVCRHVWATLLELEKGGHLQKWPAGFPTKLMPAEADPEGEDDFDEFEDEYEEYGAEIEGKPKTGAKHIPPSAPNSWKHLLAKINQPRVGRSHRLSWPANREILYVIENARRSTGMVLALQIDFREPRKNGGWKKPRPLSMSNDLLSDLPDPVDREILARLIGVQRETWYYGPYESIYRFQPEGHELEALLPTISRTGRLYFRTPEIDEVRAVAWDNAGPWEFRIDVRHDPSGGQYEVRGAFHRNADRMDISQPEHIYPAGILLNSDLVARFHGAYEWISFFRREESFFVPENEADQWLETMVGLPTLPPMDLPEELRLQEIEPVPQRIARVSTRKEAWGAPFLLGEIFFDYLGNIINEAEPTTGIPLVSQRQKILRNLKTEALAKQDFETAGFRKQRDYRGTLIWSISQARLPSAVRDLVGAGWQVEAEGKLFRNPDSFKLHLSSGIDWFELHGTVDFGTTSIAIPRLLSALRRHENAILLDDGSFGMVPEEWLQKYGILAGLGTTEGDHVRFKQNQAGLLDALLASQPDVSCDELFERMRDELRTFQGVVPADPPPGFRGSLRPYQREGLGWIHFLQKFGLGGCLADDMGLGKTIQVLALMEARRVLREVNRTGDHPPPSLVVMPRSLVFNWLQEAARFTPALRILEHTGGERIRGHEHFDDYDVVFTTYGTLRRDAPFFKEKLFDYVILDEAQAIKNASTESAKAARLLKARYRLALSGTPIENHIGELWSLFEFLNPGMLGSASVFRLGKNSSNSDEQQRALLAQALRPFILRRTKAQVAKDLPEKVEQILFCHLEPAQRTLYNELRDHYRGTLLDRIEREGIEKSKIHILEALLRLRQAAIHPGLIDPARGHEPSAKMDMLLPQLTEVLEEGHKALVFSQFTSMLGILRRRLDEEKIRYEYLDGQTRDRAAPVGRFQNDPNSKLFLISLKAGGLGLNLTAAEYVYLLDPWWNPAVEAQAVDRTHRIGQTQSVFAYRLISRDTVEEKVLELQQTKRDIADAIINQDNSLLRDLSQEDLAVLLD